MAGLRASSRRNAEGVRNKVGSHRSVRVEIRPPADPRGNVPTPITSPLPAEKHFHTRVNGAEHRALKMTELKSAHFAFLIWNAHTESFPTKSSPGGATQSNGGGPNYLEPLTESLSSSS